MSVDYYHCDYCGDIFSDCGDCGSYFLCDCEYIYCSEECGGREELDIESSNNSVSCKHCRLEFATKLELLKFAVQKLIETGTIQRPEDLEKAFLSERAQEKNGGG